MARADPFLCLRRYDSRDSTAVWRLHELGLRDTGTEPGDLPGVTDLRDVSTTYLETGGEFLIGVVPEAAPAAEAPAVHDGIAVAMGGYLPSEGGHDDERSVPGAAELHRMRVAPACQRQGYGRRLLGALESRARLAGFDPVLATTARRQAAAVAFYASEGYRQVGESTVEGYELVHFEKSLGG